MTKETIYRTTHEKFESIYDHCHGTQQYKFILSSSLVVHHLMFAEVFIGEMLLDGARTGCERWGFIS